MTIVKNKFYIKIEINMVLNIILNKYIYKLLLKWKSILII
jgi:hypothetical protein